MCVARDAKLDPTEAAENFEYEIVSGEKKLVSFAGSNVSLSIDNDMRLDMNFSKCNLEMADFLGKLPKLGIFDNFRSMMKDVWRAWMAKQVGEKLHEPNCRQTCSLNEMKRGGSHERATGVLLQTLTIYQQLEAGVRYFDLHVTKYRGALYGEHGLFTKPLKQYLKHMVIFLEEHPKEVLILHFQVLNQCVLSCLGDGFQSHPGATVHPDITQLIYCVGEGNATGSSSQVADFMAGFTSECRGHVERHQRRP